jgi:hypothetical protein
MVAVEFASGEYVSIPASGHGRAVLCPALTGGVLAVCACSAFAVIRDTEAEAVAELAAHIAEATA